MTWRVRSSEETGAEVRNAPDLQMIGRAAQEYLAAEACRPRVRAAESRSAIRLCANTIRAAHRDEFAAAAQLLADAGTLLREMAADLREHQDIFHAGFVADAQKEYSEAALTCAFIKREPLPAPGDWASSGRHT